MLGGKVPRDFRDDCSGFVASAAARVDLDLAGGTADLYAQAEKLGVVHHRKHPERGDLVFFDRTYDRDGNGRFDDRLTHVGIVLDTAADGTVRVAHRANSAGLSLLHMNLEHPDVAVGPAGEVWNEPLRRARNSRDQGDTLSGVLWTAFAAVRDQDVNAWVP